MDKIVSATVILAEEADFAGMNEEWLEWFPVDPPARQGAKLPVRIPWVPTHCSNARYDDRTPSTVGSHSPAVTSTG